MSKTGAVRMEIGSRPLRDEITQLCVTRAANLQRGIISDPLELNLSTGTAFADLQSTTAPTIPTSTACPTIGRKPSATTKTSPTTTPS
jgi:hypothetical protein